MIGELIKKLQKLNINVDLVEGELKLKAPKGTLSPDLVSEIKQNKAELTEWIRTYKEKKGDLLSIPKVELQESYPLSSSQRRIWLLSQTVAGSIAYNMPSVYTLEGQLDVTALESAFVALISRYEILRTVFQLSEREEIRQVIKFTAELGFHIDYQEFDSVADSDSIVRAKVQTAIEEPFDLEKGPLIRVGLFKTRDIKYVFQLTLHHIISDGWSSGIIIRELFSFYESFCAGTKNNLEPLPIQYKDYACWQHGRVEEEEFQSEKSYWIKHFEQEIPELLLPIDHKRPLVNSFKGGLVNLTIDAKLSHGLILLFKKQEASLFVGLTASLNAFLSRYTGQLDIVVGCPVAGRHRLELEGQIGFFINTLALRNQFNKEDSFLDLLKNVKKGIQEAFKYQEYPFDELISELKLTRARNRNPLFDVMITLQNIDLVKTSAEKGSDAGKNLIIHSYDEGVDVVSKFDLTFGFSENTDGLKLFIEFSSDLFERSTIERMGAHYIHLLESLVAYPDALVSKLDFLENNEKQRLLFGFSEDQLPISSDSNVISLFEEVVLIQGDSKALVYEGGTLTYSELNSLSNRLSAYLVRVYGLKGNALVGISLERTEWLVVAILGVLKSGYAYVPIDPEYPQDRITHMLSDSGCEVVIDRALVDQFMMELYGCSEENPGGPSSQTDLAYVIYTSGSTGLPKGVMIEHRGLLNTIEAQKSIFGVSTGDHHLQFASASFDASVSEIFCSLLSGGVLYMVSETVKKSPELFGSYLVSNKISLATIPPSYMQMLDIAQLSGLNTLVSAGEASDVSSALAFTTYGRYVNAYGPTETSICATTFTLDQGSGSSFRGLTIPIGSPIAHVEVCILDGNDQLLPVGLSGELCIGGAGLARGYLNNEALTNSKFIAHPYKTGVRLYRTGDLARWQREGVLEYIGRKDDQIKIHGYRIEPGEIEAILQCYPGVKSSVVAMVDMDGEKTLVAYLRGSDLDNSSSLRSYLRTSLPSYMIPSHFVVLEQFPVTANGKIDKKRLPAVNGLSLDSGTPYVTARNTIESTLVQIWESVLGKERMSVKDNFFELGGDSIKSIQVVSRLRPFGYVLKVVDLIETPVLEELSRKVRQLQEAEKSQDTVLGAIPISPVQSIYFERFRTDLHYNNHSVLLKSREHLDRSVVEEVFKKLLEHHDALRMVYWKESGKWFQENKGVYDGMFNLQEFDFRGVSGDDNQIRHACNEVQSGMNLSQGPLVGVGIIHLDDGDRLLIAIHHLVTDGISWRILFEDIALLYNLVTQNKLISLPLKTDSFKAWMLKQQEYGRGSTLAIEQPYWSIVDLQLNERLPIGDKNGRNLVKDSRTVRFSISKEQVNNLAEQSAKILNTDIQSVLLSGLMQGVHKLFGVNQVAVTLEGHGREDLGLGIDLGHTVGWFTSLFPVILEISKDKGILQELISVKETLKSIPNKGIGYGQLKYLSGTGFQGGELPQITFNYLGEFGSGLGSGGEEKESLFEFSGEDQGSAVSPDQERMGEIDITGILLPEGLEISITYSEHQYKASDIEGIKREYEKALLSILSSLSSVKERIKTASDFTYKDLKQSEISELEKLSGRVEDVYGLSPLQSGMYYHWMLDKSSYSYFDQVSYRISGHLDEKTLGVSYQYLVNRHPVLRTCFKDSYGGSLLQVVLEGQVGDFRYKDISGESKAKQEAYLIYYRERDKQEGFDLGEGSQARLSVICLDAGSYEFIWSFHHILMDGWCISILNGEFYNLYNSISKREPVDLPSVPRYGSYIKWLSGLNQEEAKVYWKNYLEGFETASSLPHLLKIGEQPSEISEQELIISGDHFESLRKLNVRERVTINTILQAMWGILLSKYTNTTDVVFGSVVSGRPAELDGIEKMVGLFINTVPVRIKYSEKDSLLDVLRNLQKTDLDGKDYHYTQLADIQSSSELGRGLFDHILVFENYPVGEKLKEEMSQAEGVLELVSAISFEQTNFDFTIIVKPASGNLVIQFQYNETVFRKEFIENLLLQYKQLLLDLGQDPSKLIKDVAIVQGAERRKLLETYNDTAAPFAREKTMLDIFYEQVSRTPDHIAVIDEYRSITYKELDKQSTQLAQYLLSIVKDEEKYIVIHQERTVATIISLYAVMKAGKAYAPVEPYVPEERKRKILDTISWGIILADEISYTESKGLIGNGKIVIDVVQFLKEEFIGDLPMPKILPEDVAYIIFTSGSTGLPKGVIVQHRPLINIIEWVNKSFLVGPEDKLLCVASISFDLSVYDIFGVLATGASIRLASNSEISNPEHLADIVYEEQITFWDSAPAALNQIVPFFKDKQKVGVSGKLRLVFLSGDWIPLTIAPDLKLCFPLVDVIGLGGATEAAIWSNFYPIKEIDPQWKSIPYGRPIQNAKYYVLDERHEPKPIGVIGDLYIGGEVLALGYNDQEISKLKFIPNPHCAGERIYMTGDKARFYPDGNIEFIGRVDDQVKIRGYRIELGEIEVALMKHPAILNAVLQARGPRTGEKELIAYLVSGQELNVAELRKFLKEKLPDYMVPSHFVRIDAVPLSSNGKLNKKALPDPAELGLSSGIAYRPPTSKQELVLCGIWAMVLGVNAEKIGLDDDFFALGGHSLKATRLASLVFKEMGVKLELKEVFTHRTLSELAIRISLSVKDVYSRITRAEEQEFYPLSPSQLRLWLVDAIVGKSTAYNIYSRIEIDRDLDPVILETAVNLLVEKQESLRTVFLNKGGEPRQHIIPADQLSFEIQILNEHSDIDREVSGHEFDLQQWPLFKIALMQSKNENALYYNIHHIISDGWSMEIFVRDLMTCYSSLVKKETPALPNLPIRYRDYSEWQNKLLASQEMDKVGEYWKSKLDGEIPNLRLPVDFAPDSTEHNTPGTGEYNFFLSDELAQKIDLVLKERKVSLFAFLVAGFKILIRQLTGENDIIIGTPVANRSEEELKDLIGFFLNTLMLRDYVDTGMPFNILLQKVDETIIGALDNQSYPFETLLEKLDIPRDSSHFPISPVFLNMLNFNSNEVEYIEDFKTSHVNLSTQAKFDLECYFRKFGNGISVSCLYKSNLFKKETIEYWMAGFVSILTQVATSSDRLVNTLKAFQPIKALKRKIGPVNTFEPFEKSVSGCTVISRFEQIVVAQPEQIALVQDGRQVTYAELNARANDIASAIIERIGSENAKVALLLEHGESAIVAMLAVMKSGNVYVPMDHEYPVQRLEFMMKDSDSKLVIVSARTQPTAELLKGLAGGMEIVNISDIQNSSLANLKIKPSPSDQAYVLYTSGSTGEPKGVVQSHENVFHFVKLYTDTLHISSEDRLVLLSSYIFDSAVQDIYGALCNGASVHVFDLKHADFDYLPLWLNEHKISILHLVPTVYRYLMEASGSMVLGNIRLLVLGGEAVFKSDFDSFKKTFSAGTIFVNGFGATESTMIFQNFLDHSSDITCQKIPVGFPVEGTKVYLLDENDREVEIYEEGEIVYNNNHLALGYLNKAEQTNVSFTMNPVTGSGNVYRSGDIGRMLPSGGIEFVGRKGTQVKIRGQRIELSEIEQRLMGITGIKEAVVEIKNFLAEDSLVGYVRLEQDIKEEIIRKELNLHLPDYMVPERFVILEKMPLTSTGKISRKNLPMPVDMHQSSVKFKTAGTEIEIKLIEIWSHILNVEKEKIGTLDNFFQLGGHSLKAILLIARLSKEFNVEFDATTLFGNPTIEAIASEIEKIYWTNDELVESTQTEKFSI
jgi:bacitracin synthase 3